MHLLLIHQNFPGQFKLLLRVAAAKPGWNVVGVGQGELSDDEADVRMTYLGYRQLTGKPEHLFPPIQLLGEQVRRGRSVFDRLCDIAAKGFRPDVILVHPGWGEAIFLRSVFPKARIISYLEYFYREEDSDLDFDPEFPVADIDRHYVRLRNAASLLAFAESDVVVTPTRWQANLFPPPVRQNLLVQHEGVETAWFAPRPDARFAVSRDLVLTPADEVISYVSRSLEPYRGFHTFMRALPELLRRRPNAHVVVIGDDGVSYGRMPAAGWTWREVLLGELDGKIDASRVHFVGRIHYERYRDLLHVSSCHVYLTYPFVLSWSLIEAMAAGCAIAASATGPVLEVIDHDRTGLTFDFFDKDGLVEAVAALLEDSARRERLGKAARAYAVEHYDFASRCAPAYFDLIAQA